MSSLTWQRNWDDVCSNNVTKISMWNNSTAVGSEISAWPAKSESVDESDKSMFIKSIWSSSSNDNVSVDASSIIATESHITPTNSPSMKRDEIVLNNERWGSVKINQTSLWDLGDMENDDCDKRAVDPMVWRAKIDGTEVWEDYYAFQHGKRRPESEGSFHNDVWSGANDSVGSPTQLWGNKHIDNTCDVFVPNTIALSSGVSTQPSNMFSGPSNGVRPNMTRQQAQKYLTEMGYSLSDAIGALVRNQMDLSKALIDLQNKHRVKPTTPNVLPSPNYNNYPFPMDPMASGMNNRMTPSIMSNQNVNTVPSFLGSNYSSNVELFNGETNSDQMMDSKLFMDSPRSHEPPNNIISGIRSTNQMHSQNNQPTQLSNISSSMRQQSNQLHQHVNSNGRTSDSNFRMPSQQMSFPGTNPGRPITSSNPLIQPHTDLTNNNNTNNNNTNNNNNNAAAAYNYLSQNMARINLNNNQQSFNMRNSGGGSTNSSNNNSNNAHFNSNMANNNNNNNALNSYSNFHQMTSGNVYGRNIQQQQHNKQQIPFNHSHSQQLNQSHPIQQQPPLGHHNPPHNFHNNNNLQNQQHLHHNSHQSMFNHNNSMLNWHSSDSPSSSLNASINSNNGGGGGGNNQSAMPIITSNQMINNQNNSSLSNNGANFQQQFQQQQHQSMSSSLSSDIISQTRLAKSFSCSGYSESKICGIVIRKVQQSYVDYIKQICMESGSYPIHCQFVPMTQSLLCQLSSQNDAYRCISIIQNKFPQLRIEIINSQEEYLTYLSGAA